MKFPVPQPYKVTTPFSAKHPGIDIAPVPNGKTGVPAFAPEGSYVITSAYRPALEGNYIILRGDSGRFYYFGHFAERRVTSGQKISEGQIIGILGKTGKATGIHTHFEVRSTPTGGQSNPLSINWSQGEEEPMFNDGDRKNWLAEAFVQDVGQYSNLVGKVSFKDALETMRRENLFRANEGDIINEFRAFLGRDPTPEDLAAMTHWQHKRTLYDKWMRQGLKPGISDAENKVNQIKKIVGV